jgi:DNA-binding IclR family transcriptional regulator
VKREISAAKLVKTQPIDKDISHSIVKAAGILREVGSAKEGRTLMEVVAATGLSTTVCFRMLSTLERERFVEKDGSTGRYTLGLSLIGLARLSLQQQVISQLTARMMADAARELNDVALLMVPDGDRALCIDRKEGDTPIITSGTTIGSRPPFHCGGAPFAILAFSPDDFIEEYLARPLEKPTSRSVNDPRKIRARIREAKELGYTVGNEDLFEHVVAVGVPIFGPTGTLLGSISIGGVKPRYDEKRIREAGQWLRKAAQDLY